MCRAPVQKASSGGEVFRTCHKHVLDLSTGASSGRMNTPLVTNMSSFAVRPWEQFRLATTHPGAPFNRCSPMCGVSLTSLCPANMASRVLLPVHLTSQLLINMASPGATFNDLSFFSANYDLSLFSVSYDLGATSDNTEDCSIAIM